MKRDLDLIRELLLIFEEKCSLHDDFYSDTIEIKGYTLEEIVYHIGLLAEAGYVEALKTDTFNTLSTWNVIGLTWQGHDFLDAAKDSSRWKKAKAILQGAGAFGIDAVKIALSELLKNALNAQFT